MLESLHISNYALIDAIDIDFRPGFNIITGETGAGKSIILGALGLLLGGRADSKTIRNSGRKSVIECSFLLSGRDDLKTLCAENDLDWNDTDNRLIMRRELSSSGRSRSFVNDTPVNLSVMQTLGLRLIDIHSQHENQLLTRPEFQLEIIDSLADNAPLLEKYNEAYGEFRKALKQYRTTQRAITADRDNQDFMEYQLAQLLKLNLKDGELESLENERDIIAASSELKAGVSAAIEALSEGEANILSLLDTVIESVDTLESLLNTDDDLPGRLESVRVELNDISQTLSTLEGDNHFSATDLDYIDGRISDIRQMMSRHHVDTDAELVAVQQAMSQRLEALQDSDNILGELEQEARKARKAAMTLAREISSRRQEAALRFAAILTETARPLGMKNLVCEIDVATTEMGPTGIDTVEMRFAFNKNQTPIAVGGAASGGEISRLMLCIKSIIADKIQLPTIIFDEVDTGVSGDVASRMGRMMRQMASNLQVIAITHLPQVAALGSAHYKVYKADSTDATHTYISMLSQPQRIDEIALMLSGDPTNEAARANAVSLLDAQNS